MPQINLNIKGNWFNDVYFPLLFDYSKRYEVYYGGSGSGKSQFVFQKIIIKALNRKRKVLVARKVARTNLNSTYQMTIDILDKLQIKKYCKINLSTMQITLPNDSVFIFTGLDDAEKIKSISGITDIVVEEATELNLDDYTQLDLRLRADIADLQLICMFNPISKANWTYKRWFADDSIVDHSSTMILKTTYLDNRFLPKSYTDNLQMLAQTNPAYYRIYALGEFCSLDKLVFANYAVKDFDRSTIQGELAIGIDFGFTNDLCTIVSSIVDQTNKTIYIFDAWGERGKTNQELAEIIKAKGYSKSTIIADAAEPKSIEEIKRCGVYRIRGCIKGQDSILYGIQKLQQYQIIVSPNCQGLIEEFQNYSWKKDKITGEYINEPIDKWNHYIDALRYSMQCIDNKHKVQILDKFY